MDSEERMLMVSIIEKLDTIIEILNDSKNLKFMKRRQ